MVWITRVVCRAQYRRSADTYRAAQSSRPKVDDGTHHDDVLEPRFRSCLPPSSSSSGSNLFYRPWANSDLEERMPDQVKQRLKKEEEEERVKKEEQVKKEEEERLQRGGENKKEDVKSSRKRRSYRLPEPLVDTIAKSMEIPPLGEHAFQITPILDQYADGGNPVSAPVSAAISSSSSSRRENGALPGVFVQRGVTQRLRMPLQIPLEARLFTCGRLPNTTPRSGGWHDGRRGRSPAR